MALQLKMYHRKMLLEGSGIDQAVVDTRGYRTVDTKADLKRRGFSETQCSVPGLLIPVYGPGGEVVTYQYRPDQPRIGKEGKPVKYETPHGSQMVLDVPPYVREMLGDPSAPLFITEGVKKGDALVSRSSKAECFSQAL